MPGNGRRPPKKWEFHTVSCFCALQLQSPGQKFNLHGTDQEVEETEAGLVVVTGSLKLLLCIGSALMIPSQRKSWSTRICSETLRNFKNI